MLSFFADFRGLVSMDKEKDSWKGKVDDLSSSIADLKEDHSQELSRMRSEAASADAKRLEMEAEARLKEAEVDEVKAQAKREQDQVNSQLESVLSEKLELEVRQNGLYFSQCLEGNIKIKYLK